MAKRDFFDIKDLGNLPSDEEQFKPPYQPPHPYRNGHKQSKANGKPLGFGILGLVVVALLVGGSYYLVKHHKAKPAAASSSNTGVQPAPTTTSVTTQYVSNGTDLNLSFSYPANWNATPSSGNNKSDQTITLTSPLTSIPSSTGSSVTGRVVLTIRPGSSTISELNANNPTTPVASIQMAYVTPTASQYQYPYLTFVHFSNGASASGAFEEVIITGNTSFTQGQQLSADELSTLDPIISATFSKCVTNACSGSNATPLSINSNIWQTAAICQQVQAVFASMKLN